MEDDLYSRVLIICCVLLRFHFPPPPLPPPLQKNIILLLFIIIHNIKIYIGLVRPQFIPIINNILEGWWLLISRVFNIHQNIHVERAKASIRPPM